MSTSDTESCGGPILVNLATVQIRPVEWLWPDRIPMGKITVIYGHPGCNKSFLTLDLAARVSTGAAWPDNPETFAPQGKVILMSCEDAIDDTIAPRLVDAGADLRRIELLTSRRMADGEGGMIESDIDLQDIATIRRAVEIVGNVKLIVIDPISGFMGRADSHNNTETRAVLRPLAMLAAECGAAVVLVTHTSKNGSNSALMRAMGSVAFVAAARAAFLLVKDKGEPKRRLFVPTKSNLGNDLTGMAFSLVNGKLEWEPDPILQTADELMGAMEQAVDGPAKEWELAADWLQDFLAMGGKPSTVCEAEGVAAGFAKQTIRIARQRLGIKPRRERFGPAGSWYWALPALPKPPSGHRCSVPIDVLLAKKTEQEEQEEHLCDYNNARGGSVRGLSIDVLLPPCEGGRTSMVKESGQDGPPAEVDDGPPLPDDVNTMSEAEWEAAALAASHEWSNR